MEKKEFEIVRPNVYGYEGDVYFSATNRSLFHAVSEIYKVIRKNIGILKEDNGPGKKRSNLELELKNLESLHYGKSPLEPILYRGFSQFNLGYVINAGTAFADKNYIEWKELSKAERKTKRQKRRIITLEKKVPKNCAYLWVLAGNSAVEEGNPSYIGSVRMINVRDKNNNVIDRTRGDLLTKLQNVEGPNLSLNIPIIFEQHERLKTDIDDLINRYGHILLDNNWRKKLFFNFG